VKKFNSDCFSSINLLIEDITLLFTSGKQLNLT